MRKYLIALGTAVAAGGNWTITTSALTETTHNITAKATDTAGDQSVASATFTVS